MRWGKGRVVSGGYPPRTPADPYVYALVHTVPQIKGLLRGRILSEPPSRAGNAACGRIRPPKPRCWTFAPQMGNITLQGDSCDWRSVQAPLARLYGTLGPVRFDGLP